MPEKLVFLVGTVGQGVMRSADGGVSWRRVGLGQGMHSDALMRCLVNHPRQLSTVFAGCEKGIYRSDDAGENWRLLQNPLNDYAVWNIAIDPADPNTMFAGTGTPNPATMWRSRDGGQTWSKLSMQAAPTCPAVGVPRVTAIVIDPDNRRDIWVGLEVDGVRRSLDGGDTWATVSEGLPNLDVHNITIIPGPPKTNVVVVNDNVYTSRDGGKTWRAVGVKENFPLTYPRGILAQPGHPTSVFLTLGDTTPGRIGTIMRSNDAGQTWQEIKLAPPPNSAMWVVTTQPSNPNLMLAGSRYGHLFRSDDGGATWQKLWREVSEVSSIVWLPG